MIIYDLKMTIVYRSNESETRTQYGKKNVQI